MDFSHLAERGEKDGGGSRRRDLTDHGAVGEKMKFLKNYPCLPRETGRGPGRLDETARNNSMKRTLINWFSGWRRGEKLTCTTSSLLVLAVITDARPSAAGIFKRIMPEDEG